MSASCHGSPQQRLLKPASVSIWALDVLMALLILMLLNMLALQSFSGAIFKAKATQSISAVKVPHQLTLIEHYAHSGEWLDSDVELHSESVAAGAHRAPATDDAADRLLSGRLSMRAGTGKGDDAKGERVGATTAGISDGVIVTLGIYSGFEGVAMLGVRPAVIDAPEQPVVLWLCGRTPLPAGWLSPLAAAPTNLPDPLLFSICRGKTLS